MTATTLPGFKTRATEEWLDLVFFRKIAARLVPVFISAKITPNQISIISLFFGLLSAGLLIPHQFILSAIAAVLAIIVDCCDGQVARLTGQTSPMGRVLDGMVDFAWITAFWVVLYKDSAYFTSHGVTADVQTLMLYASIAFMLQCWRYDGIKVKSNELIYADSNKQDLDVSQAITFMKESFSRRDILNTFLAICNVVQTFLFVRGIGKKQACVTDPVKRQQLKDLLEPIIDHFSWLGVTHHNVPMLLATLMAPWTAHGFVAAFWFMLVPMNLWWLIGELRYARAKRLMRGILIKS